MAWDGEERGVAARYLLLDLPPEADESDLQLHFSGFGELEEASIKRHPETGETRASVKFANPTLELRGLMLNRTHEIRGVQVTVQTWKMQKLARPGYKAAAVKGGKFGKSPPVEYTLPSPLAAGKAGKGAVARYGAWEKPDEWGGRTSAFGPFVSAPCGMRSNDWDYSSDDWGYGPVPAAFGGGYGAGSCCGGKGWGPYGAGWVPPGKGGTWGSSGAAWGSSGSGPGGVIKAWTGSSKDSQPACWGKASSGKGVASFYDKDKDITARYLLTGLPQDATEEDLRNYFSTFGAIEEVTMRAHGDSGEMSGSVKFMNPTMDLRKLMLNEVHEIRGVHVTVQTWKMRKLQRPLFRATGKGPPLKGELEAELAAAEQLAGELAGATFQGELGSSGRFASHGGGW